MPPSSNETLNEAIIVDGLEVVPVRNLPEVVQFFKGEFIPEVAACNRAEIVNQDFTYDVDFPKVGGQEHAKRRL